MEDVDGKRSKSIKPDVSYLPLAAGKEKENPTALVRVMTQISTVIYTTRLARGAQFHLVKCAVFRVCER